MRASGGRGILRSPGPGPSPEGGSTSYRVTDLVWKNSRAEGAGRLLLLAIASFADDDGLAWPSAQTLSDRTKIHARTIRKLVAGLVALGELEVVSPGGGRASTRYRVVTADAPQPVLMPRTNGHRTPGARPPLALRHPGPTAPPGGASGPGRGETGARAGGHPYSPEPVMEPVSQPVIGSARGAEAQTRMPTVRDEIRAQLKAAWDLWLEGRRKAGIPRWTDGKARSAVRTVANRALLDVEWRDLEAAIRVHSRDPKANPWYLDEKAREQRGHREELESLDRRMREREELERRERAAPPPTTMKPLGGAAARLVDSLRPN